MLMTSSEVDFLLEGMTEEVAVHGNPLEVATKDKEHRGVGDN
jgi:hypothetical protein